MARHRVPMRPPAVITGGRRDHHPASLDLAYPLRGRDAERALLKRQLDGLERGHGAAVTLEAAAGMGKTRLLSEAAALAVHAGIRVSCGGGDPRSTLEPLGAFSRALDTLLDLEPARALACEPDQRFWMFEELHERLERAALEAPLVIVLDDLHVADPATLMVLRALAPRLMSLPILWLLAWRPAEASAELEATADRIREARAWSIALDPLDEEAVTHLVQDVAGGAPDERLLELAREAAGWPFVLVELLRGLRDEGSVELVDGQAALIGPALPARLRESVARRLDALDDDARDVIRAASILGRSSTLSQIATLLQRSPVSLSSALNAALSSQLLIGRGTSLTFRHDLVREAVDATIAPDVRRRARRRVVSLLAAGGTAPSELADLLLDVAQPGDDETLTLMLKAAHDLVGTAPSHAATLQLRVLELLAPEAPERGGLVADTIALLWQGGRAVEARELASSHLAEAGDPVAEAHIRLNLARLAGQYSFEEGVAQARAGAALDGVPPKLRAKLLAVLSVCLVDMGLIVDAADAATQAHALAATAGAPAAQATALTVLSCVRCLEGDLAEAMRLADEAVELSVRPGSGTGWMHGHETSWRGLLNIGVGKPQAAIEATSEGVREAQRHRAPAAARLWMMIRSRAFLEAGQLEAAQSDAEAALAMEDELGGGDWADTSAGYTQARVAIHRGDELGMVLGRATAERMRASTSLLVRRQGTWLAALLEDAAGASQEAAAFVAELTPALSRPGPTLSVPMVPGDLPMLVRIALRADDRELAAVAASGTAWRADRAPDVEALRVAALHAQALLDEDVAALAQAVDGYRRGEAHLHLASALEDVARLHADHELATAALREAAITYGELGAERDAIRVRRRLRERGVRLDAAVRGRAQTGWESLTPAELQVVRQAAGGATNRVIAERLFLSPHTVGTHLRSVFAKLGIRSRVDLVGIVAERDREVTDA